jgi:hypothetical protein
MRKFVLGSWKRAAVAGALIGFIAVAVAQYAHGQITISGPNQYNLSVTTTAVLGAVPQNPSRRALVICNLNSTATNTMTVTFGSTTPVSGTTGYVIPGGNVAFSCLTIPPVGLSSGVGAQVNVVGSTSLAATVLEF